jgi:hypothetical protein
MSTSDQSRYAPVSIDLRCDFPGAEIVLVDGEQRLIARGQQQLLATVTPGLYIVRVIVGDSIRDETVVIRPDKPFAKHSRRHWWRRRSRCRARREVTSITRRQFETHLNWRSRRRHRNDLRAAS